MNAIVRQLVRSAIRDCASWRIGDLWPSSRPATTTAITPEACTFSAEMYAANGTTSEMPTSRSGSVTRLRSQATTMKNAMPMIRPPPAARTKSTPTSSAVTLAPAAAMAVRRATRAVASLSSDSPSRIVTTRRGRPIRRPTAVAATASGGATTAPMAIAAGQPIPGSIACTSRPTPADVKMTRPTESSRIGRRLALKSTSEVWIATE